MGVGWKFKLQAKFNMLGPDLFLQLNSKQMKDKYISNDNIFMNFIIVLLYEEILHKFIEERTQPGIESTGRVRGLQKGVILVSGKGAHHLLCPCSLAVHYTMRAQSLAFHKGGSNVDEGTMGYLKGPEQLGIKQRNHKQRAGFDCG